jgi:hypothetical protein
MVNRNVDAWIERELRDEINRARARGEPITADKLTTRVIASWTREISESLYRRAEALLSQRHA